MSWKTSIIVVWAVVALGGAMPAFAWKAHLQWDDPHNDPAVVAGYNLYYRRPARGEATYGIPPINVRNNLAFTVTGIHEGLEYCFVVTAYARNTLHESSYSNELCVNSKPVAKIEKPVGGSVVSGTQPISVHVIDLNDRDGSHKVTLDINNSGHWTRLCYDAKTKRYEANWDTVAIGPPFPRLAELSAIAVDPAGFVSDPALTTVTVTTPFTHTLFPLSSIPGMRASTDGNAVELGVNFTSDIKGSLVTGIRFYKGITNIGPHMGSLWKSNGEFIQAVSFTNETLEGWQYAFFAKPIPITAHTVYVASYHTASGNYAFDANYFASALDNAPLHALAVTNGVYQYGAGGFPSFVYHSSNYWVDVVVETPRTHPLFVSDKSEDADDGDDDNDCKQVNDHHKHSQRDHEHTSPHRKFANDHQGITWHHIAHE